MLEYLKTADLNKSPTESLSDYSKFYIGFFGQEPQMEFADRKNFLISFNKAVEKKIRSGCPSKKWIPSSQSTPAVVVAKDVNITKDGFAEFKVNGEQLTGSIKQYLDMEDRNSVSQESFFFFC